MKQIIYILIIFFLSSCKGINHFKNNVVYESNCKLYGEPALVVTFLEDSTFIYKKPYVDAEIIGKWSICSDTLSLFSEKFENEVIVNLSPRYKYTDINGKDAYLIKGQKLYLISKSGKTSNCYLKLKY